ncbi:MAG TPA: NCS2 family permease [Planctomycetota bacterium]|nr:NCS2 family permease [Planctomycetota bacterium]
MPWFVRGDIDGFFGLALDNFVQLLLIDTLCRYVLGFSDALLYGRVLPGVAVSLLVGNLYYAWQARQLSAKTGRSDICALPYGINTVSLFGHVFLVMLPAKLAAGAAGDPDPARVAWQAGLVACMGSALIECGGAFVAERVRKATPRAALLSTLAGIALTFISLGFLFRTFASPVVGLTTLSVVMLIYFGRVKFKGGIPGGLVAVALGTLLAWMTGLAGTTKPPPFSMQLNVPIPVIGELVEAFKDGHAIVYISVILPMGIFNVVGSLQNIESAEAAGDSFPTAPSLMVNGIGSLAAAVFGSCFPTTIYIGHPGWKAMGSRAGYSILNGVAMTFICLTGTLAILSWLVPVDAGMAIVIWIGMVITAQAFQAVPREHAPAVVVGILPGIAAWGAILAKNSLRAAGMGTQAAPFSEKLIESFKQSDTWIHGVFALEQGFIFSAMILAAMTVCLIERKFIKAGMWCLAGALLSMVGLMHSYQWTPGDTALSLAPSYPFALGYAMMAAVVMSANWITEEGEGH